MSEPKMAPYGSWKSPITSDLIVSGTVKLVGIVLDGPDIYWTESRPAEGGRYVLVRRTPDGATTDVNPAPLNARTRVHEYGGAAALVVEGTAYDAIYDRQRDRLICVREDHTGEGEAVNTIVSLDPGGDDAGGQVLISGNDFYSSPRLSPDGSRLAWLTWNHPNLPWDNVELWVAEVAADGALDEAQRVAGEAGESIFQPEWSPGGVLYFVSDRSNWWNLYRWQAGEVEPVVEMEAEFGRPQWVFGMRMYAFGSAGRIICTYTQGGVSHLARRRTLRSRDRA
jgi:hypothetical protein